MIKCPICGHDMVWTCDFSYEDYGLDGDGIVQNHTCPNCETEIIVMTPIKDEEEDDG